MSTATTKTLASSIGAVAGLLVFAIVLIVMFAIVPPFGPDLASLQISWRITVSGFAGYEAFRCAFNWLCERWSNQPIPPRIAGIRYRRNVVRSRA